MLPFRHKLAVSTDNVQVRGYHAYSIAQNTPELKRSLHGDNLTAYLDILNRQDHIPHVAAGCFEADVAVAHGHDLLCHEFACTVDIDDADAILMPLTLLQDCRELPPERGRRLSREFLSVCTQHLRKRDKALAGIAERP